MSQHFNVMDTNPNEATGRKGCLCYENGGPDTKGPYIVFNHTEMDTIRSPFPVLCANCAQHAYNDLQVDKHSAELEDAPRRRRKPAPSATVVSEADIPEV